MGARLLHRKVGRDGAAPLGDSVTEAGIELFLHNDLDLYPFRNNDRHKL